MSFENRAIDVIMIVVMVLVTAAMALVIPGAIEDAGFTGASGTLVALIPMMIPVTVIVSLVMNLISGLKGSMGGN